MSFLKNEECWDEQCFPWGGTLWFHMRLKGFRTRQHTISKICVKARMDCQFSSLNCKQYPGSNLISLIRIISMFISFNLFAEYSHSRRLKMPSSSSTPLSHLSSQGSTVVFVNWGSSTSRSFYKDVESVRYQSLGNAMLITLPRNINLFLHSVLDSQKNSILTLQRHSY